MIDAHIHLDWYTEEQQRNILETANVDGMIAVSTDLESCKKVWQLHKKNPIVYPGFGWHPEQPIPSEEEMERIEKLVHQHHQEIVAIGEVGLPFYNRQKDPTIELQPYIEILEVFIKLASNYQLPIVLHAVYEDAITVCDLLEKHHVKKAQFHWFKGDQATIKRMIDNNYMISITPDCLYEEEIISLIQSYPLELIMAETDGPWPFEGPFHGQMTHPNMVKDVKVQIAKIKNLSFQKVDKQITNNTRQFFNLHKR